MAFHLPPGYVLPEGDAPLSCARIAHAGTWHAPASITAGSTEPGYFLGGLDNSMTYEAWKPSAAPDWVEFDFGAPVAVDYLLLAGHKLASAGATVRLLYEGVSRENYLQYTTDLTQWLSVRADEVPNAATAPDGSGAAFFLREDTSVGAEKYIQRSVPIAVGTTIVFSVYCKLAPGSPRFLWLRPFSDSGSTSAFFDLETGSVVPGLASPENGNIQNIGDGWYRVWVSFTTADDTTVGFRFQLADPVSHQIYTGDGTSGLLFWRPQVEPGTMPTSPIDVPGADPVASTWHDLTGWITPDSDQPIFAAFPEVSAQKFRLEVLNAPAEIAVARLGKAMQFPSQASYPGHVPIDRRRSVTMRTNESERGKWLGRSRLRAALSGEFRWTKLAGEFARGAELKAFLDAIEIEPFAIAWRPDLHPEDVAYCHVSSRSLPAPRHEVRDFYEFGMQVVADAYE
jgi:hypothetical protein